MGTESRTSIQNSRRGPNTPFFSLLVIVTSAFFLNACKFLPPPPPPSGACQKPFEIVLTPIEQSSNPGNNGNNGNSGNSRNGNQNNGNQGSFWDWLAALLGHHGNNGNGNSGNPKPQKPSPNRFVFDLAPLYHLLKDPYAKIESIDFDFEINGRYTGADGEIKLDINGIQLYGNGTGRHYELKGFDSAKNVSRCRFHGVRMKRNGAEPIYVTLRRVLFNRGKLVVNVHSRSTQITQVTLEIKGTTFGPCSTPTPSASPSATPEPTITPAPTPQNTPTPTPIPAPKTTIQSVNPSGEIVASTTMAFTFTSDQPGSQFRCSLDGASAVSCNSPQLYSNLSNGSHQFRVFAINTEGTLDLIGASYSWKVDTTPPNVTIPSPPSTLTNKTNISLSFSSNDAKSYRCSIDAAEYAACTSPVVYSDLGEGSHLISIKAVNALGIESDTPAVFQWVIDLTAPNAQLTNVIPDASFLNTRDVTLHFAANETSTFQCNVDSMGYGPCTSPLALSSLSDGNHSILIRATDLAGNLSTPVAYTWAVDTLSPMLSLGPVTPPQGLTNASNVAVEFAANELSSFNCRVDGSPAIGCTSPFITSFNIEGAHRLEIQAIDQAGNVSGIQTVDWIMDFTLPTLNFGQMLPSPASYINANFFQAEIIPSEQVVLSCHLNGYPLNQPVSPIQMNGLSEGSYHLRIAGTDRAGNVSAPITHDFTVDLTPPRVTVSATASSETSETMNTFSFSANESASFQCNVDGAGFVACASPYVISGFANGDHVFQIQATDLAGNLSEVSTITWNVDTDTTPPIATGLTTTVTRNSVTVSWTTNEPATSKVSYGTGTSTNKTTDEDLTLVTSHSVTITGLNANTVYTVMAGGQDASGNVYTSSKKQIRTSP